MKHFCIIVNQGKNEGMDQAERILDAIIARGGTAQILPARAERTQLGEGFTDVNSILPEAEAVLVLGGDGTVIQAARELAEHPLPIMGVNLGTLGFLTEIELDYMEEALDQLMQDQYRLEERVMLSGVVRKNGEIVYEAQALNDIVITRSGFSRIVSMEVSVNDRPLTRYRGDGVILSTPTGSTAYNLSAGGPVIMPEAKAFAITPICAHSWEIRGVVTSAEDRIRVEIQQSKKSQKEEAIVSFDGNAGILLETGDVVEACQAEQKTRFIKLDDRGVLESLRDKIRNGAGGYDESKETR